LFGHGSGGKIKNRPARRWLGLAVLFMSASGFVLKTRIVPAETIHLIEYGILVWSAMLAASAKFSKGKAYLLALGLISLAGARDEVIQWLLPNRVGEIRDVLINISDRGMGWVFWAWSSVTSWPVCS
jgi:VanZ family protein